jgi:protein dithiol oxidoreductase (disulfide-forming)
MKASKALAAAATFLTLAVGAWAQAPSYAVLTPPQPVDTPGKIEVTEFFWYGCPHCYHLEPSVNAWLQKKPDDVVFKRVPAVPSKSWESLAVVYYTLEAMGILEKYHQKVFDAIHKDQQNLGNDNVRDKWLAANGIDAAKYKEVEKSFSVASKVARAKQLTAAYKVDGVPRIFVNGRYYTGPELAGGTEGMFAVVNQMVDVARKQKTAFAPTWNQLVMR